MTVVTYTRQSRPGTGISFETFSPSKNSPLRIIGSVGQDSRIESTPAPIEAVHDQSVFVAANELLIKQDFPLRLKQLSVHVSVEVFPDRSPPRMTQVPVIELVRKLRGERRWCDQLMETGGNDQDSQIVGTPPLQTAAEKPFPCDIWNRCHNTDRQATVWRCRRKPM